ncbi:MAG: TIGR02281 family clan AA aspartic protease, partial [Hyphomicrobiaceae bacterium]
VSTGQNNLVRLVGGGAVALGVTAAVIMHFDEVRTALGLKLEPEDFGVAASAPRAEPEVREVIRYVEREPEGADGRPRQRRASRPASAPEQPLFTRSAELRRGYDGHFHADATINGRTIPVLVDTGATLVALSYEDAQAVGISPPASAFRYVSNTANGQARFARVTLDQVRIGNVLVHNVAAAVSQPGKLGTTLLGMSFLGQLRMEMKGGTLVLEQ